MALTLTKSALSTNLENKAASYRDFHVLNVNPISLLVS